jgi:signal transduction histidine kinase
MLSAEVFSPMAVPLASVIATPELMLRPQRAPDFEAESHALGTLLATLSTSPRSALQKLAEVALELCSAHSAGISLLEDSSGVPVVRWRALAGQFAPLVGSTLPRAFSPCGAVLDHDALQLMIRPVRHFAYIDSLPPPIEETLTIPIRVDRRPLGTIWVVAHDLTRQFDAEDARLLASLANFSGAALELLISLDQIEINLSERRRAAELAIAADRNEDRFIAILAHELRNPLGPICNAAALLGGGTLDAVAASQASDIIDRQVHGMGQLIDDLLNVSRLRLGKLELRRTIVAVSEIVERTVETVGPFLAARSHALVVSLPSEPIDLDGDVSWLSQALQNLVRNAGKYTDPGGKIHIDAVRDGDEAVITVSDNGIGIASRQLDGIFDMWEQAGQASTERSEGGVGIGLYLARHVIEAHGGTLRAASDGPGLGSQFTVRVPCSNPTPPAVHHHPRRNTGAAP